MYYIILFGFIQFFAMRNPILEQGYTFFWREWRRIFRFIK